MVSWSTVTITKEKPEHVKAFVAWHLGAGAEEILLYYDDPEGPVTDFDHLPQVKVTLLDSEYWAAFGGRPDDRAKRQIHAATMGYHATKSDWLCHIDIDEFVFGNDISDLLKNVPAKKTCARMLAIERIFQENETNQNYTNTFRVPLKPDHADWPKDIFNYPDLLQRGFFGHLNGKVFARTKLENVVFLPHNIEISGMKQNQPIFCERLDNLPLLHLFTFGFEHFKLKSEWKFKFSQTAEMMTTKRTDLARRQLGRLELERQIEAKEENIVEKVFNDAFVFSSERLQKLSKHQEIRTLIFTKLLEARLRKFFP